MLTSDRMLVSGTNNGERKNWIIWWFTGQRIKHTPSADNGRSHDFRVSNPSFVRSQRLNSTCSKWHCTIRSYGAQAPNNAELSSYTDPVSGILSPHLRHPKCRHDVHVDRTLVWAHFVLDVWCHSHLVPIFRLLVCGELLSVWISILGRILDMLAVVVCQCRIGISLFS